MPIIGFYNIISSLVNKMAVVPQVKSQSFRGIFTNSLLTMITLRLFFSELVQPIMSLTLSIKFILYKCLMNSPNGQMSGKGYN